MVEKRVCFIIKTVYLPASLDLASISLLASLVPPPLVAVMVTDIC